MIDFHRLCPEYRENYNALIASGREPGCEYSFVNINLWGRQRVTFQDGFVLFFSQFDRVTVYPFPMGQGDLKAALDTLIADAQSRGIPFRLTGMTEAECQILESLYPGEFRFHTDRDSFDYVYAIEDLAELKGKRYQSKRNFANRFQLQHPDAKLIPLDTDTIPLAQEMLDTWFAQRKTMDPDGDYALEQVALSRCFARFPELGAEGLVLVEKGKCLALTIGSFLTEEIFDIHFEKALEGVDGAYAFINRAFAQHLREKYPRLQHLNREDDMGIPGLRKAKLSYHPHHMVAKYWARLWEDGDAT